MSMMCVRLLCSLVSVFHPSTGGTAGGLHAETSGDKEVKRMAKKRAQESGEVAPLCSMSTIGDI